jgi:hypothetical protein
MPSIYCVGCRKKKNVTKNLVNKVINTKTGRKISMTCGTCPTCDGKACLITANKPSNSKRYSSRVVKGSAKRSKKRTAKRSKKRTAKRSKKRTAKRSKKRTAKRSKKRSVKRSKKRSAAKRR